jgi:hypothetical protein
MLLGDGATFAEEVHTYLVQKTKFFFFLPDGKQRRGLILANPFLSLIPTFSSGNQSL